MPGYWSLDTELNEVNPCHPLWLRVTSGQHKVLGVKQDKTYSEKTNQLEVPSELEFLWECVIQLEKV